MCCGCANRVITSHETNMESPGAGGRRRGTTRVSAEDQALDQIAKEVSDHLLFAELIYSLLLTHDLNYCAPRLIIVEADAVSSRV